MGFGLRECVGVGVYLCLHSFDAHMNFRFIGMQPASFRMYLFEAAAAAKLSK